MPANHLDVLRNHGGLDSQGRSLYDRAAGRFYTPPLIGQRLARAALRASTTTGQPIKVVDPFCGDGRLISWLLQSHAESSNGAIAPWSIDLWDSDPDAVYDAKQRVAEAARQAGVKATVTALVVDSFAHAPSRFGSFDFVLTNPPWDVLKPDKRELALLSPEDRRSYVSGLRAQSDDLLARYPRAAPRLRFSGWGLNLARFGVEVALRLMAVGGVCGVVSPASFFADQASADLRKWFLTSFRVVEADYFPAEARLFVGVDQPAIAFVLVSDVSGLIDMNVNRFGTAGEIAERWRFATDLSALEPMNYSVPIHVGGDAARVLARIRHLPRFRDLESPVPAGLWAGRELDETGLQGFLSEDGVHPFVKGRMITRYGETAPPKWKVAVNARSIPQSAYFTRIAWRDVSRPSQARRMQATIIPAGWVTGNSCSVAYFRDSDEIRSKALLGVINSAVFECQVRALLATAHVSLSTVRICHVPTLDVETTIALAALVDRRLVGDIGVENRIDSLVAHSYGVADELDTIRGFLAASPPVEAAS